MLAVLLAFLPTLTAPVPTPTPHWQQEVQMKDRTSDAWVWVTSYTKSGNNLGAFCVGPGTLGSREFLTQIYEVRAEVTHRDCAHPVMLNQLRGYPGNVRHQVVTYVVAGKDGHYTYSNL